MASAEDSRVVGGQIYFSWALLHKRATWVCHKTRDSFCLVLTRKITKFHPSSNHCCARTPPRLKHLSQPAILSKQEVNALNRLALEGVLAVIESISRRCGPSSQPPPSSQPGGLPHAGGSGSPPLPFSGPHSEGLSASAGGPDSSRRGSTSDSDSDQEYIAAFGGGGGAAFRGRVGSEGDSPFGGGAAGAGELGWLERARARTAEVLQERKKMKRRLGLAARKFNSGSKGWLEYAQVGFVLTMVVIG